MDLDRWRWDLGGDEGFWSDKVRDPENCYTGWECQFIIEEAALVDVSLGEMHGEKGAGLEAMDNGVQVPGAEVG